MHLTLVTSTNWQVVMGNNGLCGYCLQYDLKEKAPTCIEQLSGEKMAKDSLVAVSLCPYVSDVSVSCSFCQIKLWCLQAQGPFSILSKLDN